MKKNGLVFPEIGITAPFLSDGEIRKMKENRISEEENEEIGKCENENIDTVFNCAANVKHFSKGTDIEDVNIVLCY